MRVDHSIMMIVCVGGLPSGCVEEGGGGG